MADLSMDGLASGFPTKEIVGQLMEVEMAPLQNYKQEKMELEEEKNIWREVNTQLDSLESNLSQLKLSSTFNSLSANSNNEVVTASANSDAEEGNYDIEINTVAKSHRLASTESVADSTNNLVDELEVTDISGDIEINETTISIDNEETLSSFKTKINESDAGINASIVGGHLVLQREETGANNNISLTDNTNGVFSELGLDGDLNNIDNDAVLELSQDADININGIEGIKSSNNTFDNVVEGVTFNIDSQAQSGDTANVSVNRDTEKATSNVQEVVDQYNKTIDFIGKQLDYDPEEDEAGPLQGDSTLMTLESKLRSMLTERVDTDNEYNHLEKVGITIDRDGVMSFDSGKLSEALNESTQEVIDLFKAEQGDEGFEGVATKMDNYVEQLLQSNTGTIPRRLDYYDRQMDRIDDDVEDLNRRLESTRQRYVNEFTAMEEAISEMQQQSNWMMSQLQGMGSSSNVISQMMG